jgi:alpha-glucosidase
MKMRVICIIDPGLKIEEKYKPYEECMKQKLYSCLNKESLDKPIKAICWPGNCIFPDFFQEKTRLWWGNLYKELLDDGVSAFWVN